MTCTQCGMENLKKALFCAQCGERLSSICSTCGEPIDKGDDICSKCGAYTVDVPISSKKKFEVTYSPKRKVIFVLAIVGLVLTSFGGFIFSIIAWVMGNKEIENHPRDWMVIAGRVSGKVFTFVGIGITLFMAAYFVILFSILAASGSLF